MSNPLYDVMTLLDDANVGGTTPAEQVANLLADYQRLLKQAEKAAGQTDYGRLLASLDEDRFEVLMLLHDACLDEGRPGHARGWGWLATHRRWPYDDVMCGRRCWSWTDAADRQLPHALPRGLYAAVMPPYPVAPARWPRPSTALRAVVDAIAQGRWAEGQKGPPAFDPRKHARPREVPT